MKYRIFLFFCLSLYLYTIYAQKNTFVVFDKNYFRNPLAIPMDLAANFGEIRKNHFHMGLDIRTQQRENLPVFAAQEGYISRISIQRGGYGRAIYVTHPKGYTTVYGHLNNFYEPLENYLREQQYKTMHWEQDIQLPSALFPVSKGQQIALSGNTGASEGPHLHFEIRNTETEANINPLFFNFLDDKISPSIINVYWYNRSISTYTEEPNLIGKNKKNDVEKIGSRYISFAIQAKDKINQTSFTLGIYEATVFVDGNLFNSFKLDSFSYNDTRYVNASIDYEKFMTKGPTIQHISCLPGNLLNIFQYDNDGVLFLEDSSIHQITIEVKDIAGNTSVKKFSIQYDASKEEDTPKKEPFAIALSPNKQGEISNNDARFIFSEKSFYDTAFLSLISMQQSFPAVSNVVNISPQNVPVHERYQTFLKINDLYKNYNDRIVMQLKRGNSSHINKATASDGIWYKASFSQIGSVVLLADTISPVIAPSGWKNGDSFGTSSIIKINCTDNFGEIENFSAMLDSTQWLLFAPSGKGFVYRIDKYCSVGTHSLMVKAKDVAGNETMQTFVFNVKEGSISKPNKEPANAQKKKTKAKTSSPTKKKK